MKTPFRMFAGLIAVAGWMILASPQSANAQAQVKVDVKIEVQSQQTPQYNYEGETKKLPKGREWAEIEVEFKVEGRAPNDIVDELEFSYFVMMADKETMLVARVTHVNVILDEETFSSMYISPTTLRKLFGREVPNPQGAIAGVAVEVRYQGALVGGDATVDPSSRWWQSRPQTSGLLLKKSETPFSPLWWDRYADVKKDG